ncbi:hypothetical protein AB4084_25815, partial [Lysobacter sp. 2RAB21]
MSGLVCAPACAGQAYASGLRDGDTYDRLIVQYKRGSAAALNAAALDASLHRAALSVKADGAG